ncbi:hypothetical protein PHMEG_00024968 [Phytophthora megakarya]|uniref:Uncharacterized protein n=1 Tax=Phytophthora megakarya TaxID=4795 RepID=A0A225VDX4_9STRA|nr:hypothetical protein PHMEG_00024968 [Phytophthora megakarya]
MVGLLCEQYTRKSSRNETIVPYQLQVNEFSACVKIITNWALYETNDIWKEAKKMVINEEIRTNCTGQFRAVNGRPCVHEIAATIESEGRLHILPSHFDKHWWTGRSVNHSQRAVGRILDPDPTRSERPLASRSHNHQRNHGGCGTGRDLVYSERVERNDITLAPTMFPNPDPEMFGTQSSDSTHTNQHEDQNLPEFPGGFHKHYAPARSWGYAGMNPYS